MLAIALAMSGAQPVAAIPEAARAQAMQCESAIAISGRTANGAFGFDNGKGLTVQMPLRIASITKTITAAAALRLIEEGKLELDAPIEGRIDPRIADILTADGYDVTAITLRHLLSHSAGLYSHAEDPRYGPRVFADPTHEWTREEQVGLMAEYGDAVGAPGERFVYSDTGYVIVGDMIERASGMTLPAAVRSLLGLDAMALGSTWWDEQEAPRGERARQFVGGMDVTDVHGSADTYGGGGLVMPMEELARLYEAAVSGALFAEAETVRAMRWQGSHEGAERYRLGLFAMPSENGVRWWHSGFWGTIAMSDPEAGVTLAGATNEQSDFACLFGAMRSAMDALTTD